VTSLDGRTVASSKRMLLTAVCPVASSPDEKLPFLAEPIEGTDHLRRAGRLRMLPLSPRPPPPPAATKVEPIVAVSSGNQALTFKLVRGIPTHWFLLVP